MNTKKIGKYKQMRRDKNMEKNHSIFKVVVLSFLMLISTVVFSQQKERLVWPLPPQKARVEFLYKLSNIKDLGIKKTFLRKAWDWFVGANEKERLFVKPMGIAVDSLGKIYVTDPGARCIHVFNLKNKEYESWEDAGKGTLKSPIAIAIASNGLVYVTDSVLKEVIVYNKDGDVEFTIKGYFQRPTGIVIHHNKLYVVDTALNKVLVFDLNGKLLFKFGKRGLGKGEFNFPVFITARHNLYVVDAMNFRIQEFNDSGKFLAMFGKIGDVQGTFASMKGIAVDNEGHIYIADALLDVFQIFNKKGNLLLVVGNPGPKSGQFDMPLGIFIDNRNKIYVVDALNRRVQVFKYLGNKK